MFTASILSQLSIAWGAYVLATASPGPAVMAIIGTAVSSGRTAGLSFALGVLTGSITWAVLTCLGVSALIRAHPGAMLIFQLIGGSYLIWLAYGSLKKALSPNHLVVNRHAGTIPLHRHYMRGYGLHLTNPKAILNWIMLASLAVPVGAPVGVTVFFVVVCMLLGLAIFTSFALIFSIPAVHQAYIRLRRPIEGAIAVLFGLAGIMLLSGAL